MHEYKVFILIRKFFVKVVVLQNNELADAKKTTGPKKLLLPNCSSDIEKNNKSRVLPCDSLVTESTEQCYSSENENIETEVNFIRRNMMYFG